MPFYVFSCTDEAKLPRRLLLTPSPPVSITLNSDAQGDDDDAPLRLRKRTKRGHDFTLKRAILLLQHLRAKRDFLLNFGQTPASHEHDLNTISPSLTQVAMASSEAPLHLSLPPLQTCPSEHRGAPGSNMGSRLDDLHWRTFHAADACRVLFQFSANHDHVVVDCNEAWAKATGRSGQHLSGLTLSQLCPPESCRLLALLLVLTVTHRAVVARNMPWIEAGLIADMSACLVGPQPADACGLVCITVLQSRSSAPLEAFSQTLVPGAIAEGLSCSTPISSFSAPVWNEKSYFCTGPPVPDLKLHMTRPSQTLHPNDLWREPLERMPYQPLHLVPDAAVYPPYTLFMPMSLPDGPEAELFLLPWPLNNQGQQASALTLDTHSGPDEGNRALRTAAIGVSRPVGLHSELLLVKRGILEQLFPDRMSPGLNSRLFHPCASGTIPNSELMVTWPS